MTDQPEHRKISKEEKEKYYVLIAAYGDVIVRTSKLGGDVFDISWLPASKEEIKKALRWGLQEGVIAKNYVTNSYTLLCKFQPDVGEFVPNVISLTKPAMGEILGLDSKTIDSENVEALMAYLKEAEKIPIFMKKCKELFKQHTSLRKKWDTVLQSERKQLFQDLIDLKFLPKDFEVQVNAMEIMLQNLPQEARRESERKQLFQDLIDLKFLPKDFEVQVNAMEIMLQNLPQEARRELTEKIVTQEKKLQDVIREGVYSNTQEPEQNPLPTWKGILFTAISLPFVLYFLYIIFQIIKQLFFDQ